MIKLHVNNCVSGHREVLEYMISLGVDMSLKFQNKFTPLYVASENGHVSTISCLIEHGADPTVGRTDVRDDVISASCAIHIYVTIDKFAYLINYTVMKIRVFSML